MTDEQIFETARQHFGFIRNGSATDGMGDLVRIEPTSFVVRSKLLLGLLKFARAMYNRGYSQACKDIGEWDDDHPLNRKDTAKQTYDDLWKNDFRTLCSELLAALKNAIRVIYHEDGTDHIKTADAVIAKADATLAEEIGTEVRLSPLC